MVHPLPRKSSATNDQRSRRMPVIDSHIVEQEQRDRLDAEELMRTAMHAASVTSLSTSSSVSSQRRNRPPHLPPPQLSLEPHRRSWSVSKRDWRILGMSFLLISSVLAVVGAVLELQANGIFPHLSFGMVTRSNFESRLQIQSTGTQPHRIYHTKKYAAIDGIPPFYDNVLEDVKMWSTSDLNDNRTHVPMTVHFRIPGSAQDAITHALGTCLGLTQGMDQIGANGTLFHSKSGGSFMMLDMQEAPLVNLDHVDVLSAKSLHSITAFLTKMRIKGKLVVLFRHPLERMSTFYSSSRDSGSVLFDPSLRSISFQQFAAWPQDRPEFNFVTKSFLSDGSGLITSDQITAEDFEMVKDILRTKALILLSDDKIGSWNKMVTFMNWKEDYEARTCAEAAFLEDWPKPNHPPMDPNSVTSIQILRRNQWDLQLFEFAVQLYQQQTSVSVK